MGRLAYTTTEDRLKKEFDFCGPIDWVRLVKDTAGKSRGYAFVTFKHERDATYALEKADGRKVDGKRILVDRELGRTKKSWVPRRLGGGKGGQTRRAEAADVIVEEVQRELRHEQQDLEEIKKKEARAAQ